MTETNPADSARADELRTTLVDGLVADGSIVSKEVEQAFRRVPRHRFAPEAPLEDAYANGVVRTKHDEHGVTISSVSAPWLQAAMLEQAQITAGMNCLEIGSGGFNAALMAELVGATGSVTTVDIDADVTDRASRCLAAAGYDQVRVVLRDAEQGVAEHGPYDRIVVTVGVWDLPPAWREQLAAGGRIVVPLRMRGLSRSLAGRSVRQHLVDRNGRRRRGGRFGCLSGTPALPRDARLGAVTCQFVESRVADCARAQNCGVGSADQPVRQRHQGWRKTPKALLAGKTGVAAMATPRSAPR